MIGSLFTGYMEDPDRYDGDRCPVCYEAGSCAYDGEGRPMIHTTDYGDGE